MRIEKISFAAIRSRDSFDDYTSIHKSPSFFARIRNRKRSIAVAVRSIEAAREYEQRGVMK